MGLVQLRRTQDTGATIQFPWLGVKLEVRIPNSMIISAARGTAARTVEAIRIGIEEGSDWGLSATDELEEASPLLEGLRQWVLATILMQLITESWNFAFKRPDGEEPATEPDPITLENCRDFLRDAATQDRFLAEAMALSPWTIEATEGNDSGPALNGSSGPEAEDAQSANI